MKKSKSWDEYEKELFAKGKITEDEMMVEKMKLGFAQLLIKCRIHRKLTQRELAHKWA